MQTELITYDLKTRERQYRGRDRDYQKPENLPRLIAAINSPATQEQVKNRDMLGYLGHWVRLEFGFKPQECKIKDGQVVCIEAAFVTTHLKAYKSGEIEHQADFSQTNAGELAWKLYQSRIGGFSSVIDETKPEWFGFDYVHEPNFTKNRPYTLDSVFSAILDSANDMESPCLINELRLGEYHANIELMLKLLAESDQSQRLVLDSVSSLENENKLLRQQLEAALQYKPNHNDQSFLIKANDFLSLTLDGVEIEGDKKPISKPAIALDDIDGHAETLFHRHMALTRGTR